jgi:hypothetical protein
VGGRGGTRGFEDECVMDGSSDELQGIETSAMRGAGGKDYHLYNCG